MAVTDKLLECVWPFRGVGTWKGQHEKQPTNNCRINQHDWVKILSAKLQTKNILPDLVRTNKNKKYKCSGPPTFKSQRVGYQPNQKLLHYYQH